MEIIDTILSTISTNGPPFLFVLVVVIFFHELGHFLVARWCGVGVKVFSIGLGPELIGWNDRYGTRWKIAPIPLGGYVKFVGDDSMASTPNREELEAMDPVERELAFQTKPLRHRAAIVAAGPLANFVLAILIFTALPLISGKPDPSARIGAVTAGSAAAAADLRAGDLVVAVEGQPIASFGDIQKLVFPRAGQPTELVYEREGLRHTVTVTPRATVIETPEGPQSRGLLGLKLNMLPVGPFEAVESGVGQTWYVVSMTGQFLGRLVTGRESIEQLGGPIRVAGIAGKVAERGFLDLVYLVGLLSVSIGLFNLLPIPILDGGHLFFYGVEAVQGRPMSERAQDIGFRIGMVVVLTLMVMTTVVDIMRKSPM